MMEQQVKLFVIHMPKDALKDHTNSPLPQHPVKWKLVSWVDDQITKNMVKMMQRETCQLNLYPVTNHGNCRSQSLVWPLWKPYLHNPHFTVYTIHSAN